MKRVLNVGGSSKSIPISARFDGWQQDLLDVDPRFGVDVVMDARALTNLPGGYDAVYCSHTLEHFTEDDAQKVLAEFLHILKDEGFAEIRVPDFKAACTAAVERNVELNETLYTINGFDVSLRHIIFGHESEVKRSGKDYWAHKNVYTPKTLAQDLQRAGFAGAVIAPGDHKKDDFDIVAFAFKTPQPRERVEAILRGDA